MKNTNRRNLGRTMSCSMSILTVRQEEDVELGEVYKIDQRKCKMD